MSKSLFLFCAFLMCCAQQEHTVYTGTSKFDPGSFPEYEPTKAYRACDPTTGDVAVAKQSTMTVPKEGEFVVSQGGWKFGEVDAKSGTLSPRGLDLTFSRSGHQDMRVVLHFQKATFVPYSQKGVVCGLYKISKIKGGIEWGASESLRSSEKAIDIQMLVGCDGKIWLPKRATQFPIKMNFELFAGTNNIGIDVPVTLNLVHDCPL